MATTKSLTLIDLNLISGSDEIFRAAIGGYYEIISGSYGEELDAIEVEYDGNYYSPISTYLAAINENVNLEETITADIIIPNKKIPIRLKADVATGADVESGIVSDLHWYTVLLGGTFGEKEYSAIYTDSTFDDHGFTYSISYTQMEALSIVGGSSFTDVTQISYDYQKYLSEYQNYIDNIDSDLLIPNVYLLKSFEMSLAVDSDITLSSSIKDFVTLEAALENDYVGSIFTTSSALTTYYTSSLSRYPLSASTTEYIENVLQNIMFDADLLESANSPYYETRADVRNIPLYMTFDFATSTSGEFLESIENNNFSQRFLKSLKECFLGETTELEPSAKEYLFNSEYYSGSADDATYYTIKSSSTLAVNSVDFMKLLTYSYRNNISTTDNCYFYGGESLDREAMFDSNGAYRHVNTINTLGVLNDTIDYLDNTSNFEITSIEDLYNLDPNTHETLAYRIEKIGGLPTGDSRTQNVLQNYWFINSSKIDNLDFFDSQIKYDEDYTYNIYAYVLILGKKYSFSDLRLTRQIGTIEFPTTTLPLGYKTPFSAATATTIEYRCLEFYDPTTGDPDSADSVVQLLQEWEDNPLSGSNRYATNAQIITSADTTYVSDSDPANKPAAGRYLADFYLNYEPNLIIKEIPVATKTLRVLDNPPNTFDVTPYQMIDASQTIGFDIRYEIFYDELPYPTVITVNDETRKSQYLHGKDLLEESAITLESVSRQRYVDVFRLDEKPTKIMDFDQNRIAQLELRIPETKLTYSTAIFRDRIKTNKKYYYLFRMVNEQGLPGPLSVIYEAQLVDDGGYIYSIFNIIFESELEEEIFVEPSKQFKKLFQLQPNISHLILNTDDVDFNEPASSQLSNMAVGEADDTIWNKTFKLRLTSKKTGKKIDFNVTYKLQSEL